MDATEFFDAILPAAGLRCMAIPAKQGFAHFFDGTNAWLTGATRLADSKGKSVYYAMASFQTRVSRKGDNVEAVRSFWVDLDVGPDKPYAKRSEAGAAIVAFADKVGLPHPWLVKSGRGLHVYWPMSADMDPVTWKSTARTLKTALTVEGVGQDTSRTSDIVSVLRPPGTHHRKGEPVEVTVAYRGVIMELEDFQKALGPYYVEEAEQDDGLGAMPQYLHDLGNASGDLDGGIERQPSSILRAAETCGVIQYVRDNRGNVDQPTWYDFITVAAFCEDGTHFAHEWSKGHPGYSKAETDAKLMQAAKFGPTTCERFKERQPDICGKCAFVGKSPIVAGRSQPGSTPVIEQVEVQDISGRTHLVQKSITPPWPYDFIPVNGKPAIVQYEPKADDQGNDVGHTATVICETVFYPTTRLMIDDIAFTEYAMPLRDGSTRIFRLDGAVIGKGKDTLLGELGRREILPSPGKSNHMDGYLKRWMTHLKDNHNLHTSYKAFGWVEGERAFVIGNDVLRPKSEKGRAIMSGRAKSSANFFEPKGDLQTWVSLVQRAYNAPGQEAFQFTVLASLAAPLLKLTNSVNGITVYAYTPNSGVGKTASQKVALSAWGNADDLMLADDKITPNALWAAIGAYNNLPVVYDELTNQAAHAASTFLYSVSSGRSKERLRADGERNENTHNWNTIVLASGNAMLSDKAGMHRANAEAEVVRMFEFTLKADPHLTPNEAGALFPQFANNYGHAGRKFIQHVLDNYDDVLTMLEQYRAMAMSTHNFTQVERYWASLFAVVLTAGKLMKRAGLGSFDLVAIHKWMGERLAENRSSRIVAANDPLDLLAQMLGDFSPHILTTLGEGDLLSGRSAEVLTEPRGALYGRAIQAKGNAKDALFISIAAVRQWASDHNIAVQALQIPAINAGWVDSKPVTTSLGKGVEGWAAKTGPVSCWRFDPVRVNASSVGPILVPKLTVVSGTAASQSTP